MKVVILMPCDVTKRKLTVRVTLNGQAIKVFLYLPFPFLTSELMQKKDGD